jgi:ATP-dependent DNA helicase RecQ
MTASLHPQKKISDTTLLPHCQRIYSQKEDANRNMEIHRLTDMESITKRFERRLEISHFTIEWLYRLAAETAKGTSQNKPVQFSVVELLNQIKSNSQTLFSGFNNLQLEEVEEALLYLSKIGALKLEGGFLVLYNAMNIQRIKDSKSRYKQDDYRMLNEFYKQKIQQVHIVGEYANLMVKDTIQLYSTFKTTSRWTTKSLSQNTSKKKE